MAEKDIKGGKYHSICRYRKANNNYMKNYAKNKESSHLKYWDVNSLHAWAMLQKHPVINFEWIEDTSQFNKAFIKDYNEESNEEYFLEVDFQYPEKLHEFHNDLHFLSEKMKIEKVEKLVANANNKAEYIINIRNLRQALNHGLFLENSIELLNLNKNLG